MLIIILLPCCPIDDPTWIIDPIDGTMNFVHANPLISISVALTVNKQLKIGIIYLPALDMMYTARRGHGAKLNGKKISVSSCEDLSSAMILQVISCIKFIFIQVSKKVLSFFPSQEIWARSGNTTNELWQLNCIAALMKRAHSIRCLGE